MDNLLNRIHFSDCLEVLRQIPDGSVDLVLTDPPYGTTACSWDVVIPLAEIWAEYERVIKQNGSVLITGKQPFVTDLINAKRDWFKYEIIWDKMRGTDFQLANIKPMSSHENILLFAPGKVTFNKQTTKKESPLDTRNWNQTVNSNHNNFASKKRVGSFYTENNPTTVFQYSMANAEVNNTKRLHPTQKPIALFRYLIRTYSNPGDVVFDGYGGSGTTAIAAQMEGRKFIVCENHLPYFEASTARLSNLVAAPYLFSDFG